MAPRPYSVDGRSYGVVWCVAIHPSKIVKMTFGWRYVYYEPDFFIGPQVTISHAKISSGIQDFRKQITIFKCPKVIQ